jgi:hypothetical protein
MKNSELVQELKNEFRNNKEKKEQAKLSKVETPKVEETTNGSDNTN